MVPLDACQQVFVTNIRYGGIAVEAKCNNVEPQLHTFMVTGKGDERMEVCQLH